MTIQQQTVFAFGAGYTLRALASLVDHEQWRVAGTTRSVDGIAQLEALGIEGSVFNEETLPHPPAAAHWLISTPPDDDGCPAYRAAGGLASEAASVTYLSTTGVYGDLGGGWAFEWTPRAPSSQRGARRVLAEDQWLAVRPDARIVRLPGIYGPGRSPFDRVREGTARRIIKPGQVFSRIHVGDLARGLMDLLARPSLSGVFHFCDDEPAPPQEVTAFAAELIGAQLPSEVAWESANLGVMARSFYAECKRVSNARAKSALGWRPQYSTYREGLEAIESSKAL